MSDASEDVEAFLHRLDRTFEKVDAQTFVVSLGPNQPPAVLRLALPVLVCQVDVGPAPAGNTALEAKLFRKLLELNATDLVYAAFGVDHGRIVLDAALDISSLDMNELESVLANFDLAIAEHVPGLRELAQHV